MSRTINFTSRTLAITGALLAATLAAPVAGHAQAISAERTLRNLTATPSFAPDRPYSARGPAAVDSPVGAPVDGERALLGHKKGVSP